MIIRDPVHGDIALSALEAAVLDTAEVQRLRGIKQLGTASLVYPGAVHTRFDHSLGTAEMAHRIVAALRRDGVDVTRELEDLIGAGALLHDVTHVPFGHTLEDERRLFPRHDKGTRLARYLEGGLGSALDRLGIRSAIGGLLDTGAAGVPAWAREMISSTVDADLLDYLRRDAHFTGLAQAYDDRIFQYFTVAGGHLALRMVRHGLDRPDARSEAIQLLRMRYFLTERVYYHHTKVIAGAMVSKAVEMALDSGALEEGDLLRLDDCSLLERLARTGVPAIAGLVARIERRALFKRGYVASAREVDPARRAELVRSYHESRDERRAAEAQLAAAAGCAPAEVIVYCPALTVMKEASASILTSRGLARLNDPGERDDGEIGALEARYADLWRLYVFAPADAANRVTAPAAELFGIASEYGTRE